nr:reverse transcriptase domain-containing protein [Tanacetum cinerariifolium]
MSSPTHPTPSDVDEEYAFLSANILNYTSTLPNYFPATPRNISSTFLENSKNDEILHVFLPFYNNTYLKDMQAFYTKESPIPPPDPITPLIILTPSTVIEFEDSYEVPTSTASTTTTDTTSGKTCKTLGRTVTLTAEDMQKKKNDNRTGKNISIQGSDVAGFDKSKVECFNCHKMCHFERECRAPRSQDRGRRDNFRQGSKAEEHALKALMAIYEVGWDWSYMANNKEDHALVADEVAPTEFTLMANTSTESKVFDNSLCSKDYKKNNDSPNSKIIGLTEKLFDAKNLIYHYKLGLAQAESRLVEYKERVVKYYEKIKTLEFRTESNNECIKILKKKLETLKQEKEWVDGKLAGLLTASKDLDNLIESQRSDLNKERLGYNDVPPPPAQLYSSPKKDLSWTGLPEFKDDTVTDYSRPEPTVKSSPDDAKKRNPSVSETVASPITPKPFIKFVKPKDSQPKSKTDKTKTPKKPPVKYAEQYRKTNKKPTVRGNQRNWNNLKSHQLGPNFVLKKKECYNCGDFNHLAYDRRKGVKHGTPRSKNNTHKSFISKPVAHRQYRPPCMRTRRSYFPPANTIPRRSRKQTTNVVEPEFRTIVEMADNHTMAQMLQAPIEGYEDVIVVPPINANNFELKQTLINLVQSNQFTERQDPHNHLHFFNKVTFTFRHPEVPNTTIKLLLFSFSLEGEARIWLDKEPPRSILTWEDLVSKFINQFFPPSKTTYLRNEITNFLQKPNETFNEAWMPSIPQQDEIFWIRFHVNVCRSLKIAASLEDKLDIRMNRFEKSLNDMKNSFVTPIAPLKAVEEVCVTCGANHSYNQCPLTRGNDFPVFHDNIQQFQTATVGNFIQNRNQNVLNQMRPPGFNQPTHQNNNQSRYQGNNFNQNQNRQNNQGAVYQNRPQQALNYQAPAQQNTITHSKFEAYTTANDD